MKPLPTLPADLKAGVVLSGLPPDMVISWCHQGLVPFEKPRPNLIVLDLVVLAMRMTVVMASNIPPENVSDIRAIPLTPLHLTGALSLIASYLMIDRDNARDFFGRYLPADVAAYNTVERRWDTNPLDSEAGRAVFAFHISNEIKRATCLARLHHLLSSKHAN